MDYLLLELHVGCCVRLLLHRFGLTPLIKSGGSRGLRIAIMAMSCMKI